MTTTYCDMDDVLDQLDEATLIQLTDDEDAGGPNSARLTRAINDAEALIDSYCGARYSVPFGTVPAIVRKIAVEIAIYNLYARRQGAPEGRKERYEEAVSFLKDVAAGKVSLGVQPAPEAPDETSHDAVQSSVRTKIFDEDTMDKY